MKDKLFGGAPPSGRAAKAKSGSNGPGLVARVGHASADVSSLLISRVRVKPVQSLLQLIHLLKAIPFPVQSHSTRTMALLVPMTDRILYSFLLYRIRRLTSKSRRSLMCWLFLRFLNR